MFRVFPLICALPIAGALLVSSPASAEVKLTRQGKISAAAVAELFVASEKEAAARDTAFGYIEGMVEATMAASEIAKTTLGKPLVCKSGPGSLNAGEILGAFKRVEPDTAKWGEVEATPAVVALLVAKYPCR